MLEIIKTILYKPLFNLLILLVFFMPNHNVGLAIILLTLLLRLVLLPSSLKAARQQKRLQALQPEIKKLQDRYKDDKQQQAKELMAFYQKHKVNPMGSCLPLLIQLPVLVILFYVFQRGLDTSRFDLLYQFMPRPEFINTMFLGINLAKPDPWILPIVAGALQFYQARQLMPPTPKAEPGVEEDKTVAMQRMISQQMMYLMPLMTVFIARSLPAALPLYWAVTTLFMIAQQWWVSREKIDLEKIDSSDEKTVMKKGVEVTVRKKA